MKTRIFISSVQKEFATERQALKTYILGDALLSRFFDVFLFEDLPASDRRPDDVYLDEVRRCSVYLGLFGDEYGWEDAKGFSPTHREFLAATQLGIPRLVFVKGTVFTLVDQALDFVMSKLNLSVGTRKDGPRAPVAYEIPREVVAEAIVNAVAHRDYTSNGSIQVMLFSDRLEVWNPGVLPHSLTLEKLRQPHGSIPANPLLAEPLYLTEYIERMGTGTRDMIRRCRETGLPEPEFTVSDGFLVTLRRPTTQITGQVTGQVTGQGGFVPLSEPERVLFVIDGEMTRQAIQKALQLRGRDNFENRYLKPALEAGFIERTLPDKPTSRLQKYRLTPKGYELLTALKEKGSGA